MKEGELMKKITSLLLVIMLLITFEGDVFANEQHETQNIKNLIVNFFVDYENAFANNDQEFKLMNKYFTDNNETDMEVNKRIINTVLNRRILLATKHKLQEINKTQDFTFNTIEIRDDVAYVNVTIDKKFNYNVTPDIETLIRDTYDIVLEKNKNFKIRSIDGFICLLIESELEFLDLDINNVDNLNEYNTILEQEVNKMSVEDKEDTPYSRLEPLNVSNFVSVSSTYNRAGAVAYARRHARNPNPNYANFEGDGGDCTNFVSQCLYEGGGISQHVGSSHTDHNWFYISSGNRSTSWTGAHQLYNYLSSSNSRINAIQIPKLSLQIGDIIQFLPTHKLWGHSVIVTGRAYHNEVGMDYLITQRSISLEHARVDMFLSQHDYVIGNLPTVYWGIYGNK